MLRLEERIMIKDKQLHKLSVRSASEVTGFDKETVSKYYKLNALDLYCYKGNYNRNSQFEIAIPFIQKTLSIHGKLSKVKLHERVIEAFPELTGKSRSFNDFMRHNSSRFFDKHSRPYNPLTTDPSKGQMQVDPGEATIVSENLEKFKVYFVAFVFVHSRKKYVYFQDRPIDTDDFITAFLAAFQYYGYKPLNCVFDQTKLVVLHELYMECKFNLRFLQFANKHDIKITVCRKSDPESKGKVENVVKYIKNNFLSGSEFKNLQDVRERSIKWLDTKANFLAHGTTKIPPNALFSDEIPYLTVCIPTILPSEKRKADKTSLISFEGVKYSVPSQYQEKIVSISRVGEILYIYDPESAKEVASHNISQSKSSPIIDPTHYTSLQQRIQKRYDEILALMSGVDFAKDLMQRLITDNPEIIHAQLFGLRTLAHKTGVSLWLAAKDSIFALPKITVSSIKALLCASKESIIEKYKNDAKPVCVKSKLDRNLAVYDLGVKNAPSS